MLADAGKQPPLQLLDTAASAAAGLALLLQLFLESAAPGLPLFTELKAIGRHIQFKVVDNSSGRASGPLRTRLPLPEGGGGGGGADIQ